MTDTNSIDQSFRLAPTETAVDLPVKKAFSFDDDIDLTTSKLNSTSVNSISEDDGIDQITSKMNSVSLDETQSTTCKPTSMAARSHESTVERALIRLPSGEQIPVEYILLYVLYLVEKHEERHIGLLQEDLKRQQAFFEELEGKKSEALEKREAAVKKFQNGEKIGQAAMVLAFGAAGVSTIAQTPILGAALLVTAAVNANKLFGYPITKAIEWALGQLPGETKDAWDKRVSFVSTLSAIGTSIYGMVKDLPILNGFLTAARLGVQGFTEWLEMQRNDATFEDKCAELRLTLAEDAMKDRIKDIERSAEALYGHWKDHAKALTDVNDLFMLTATNS